MLKKFAVSALFVLALAAIPAVSHATHLRPVWDHSSVWQDAHAQAWDSSVWQDAHAQAWDSSVWQGAHAQAWDSSVWQGAHAQAWDSSVWQGAHDLKVHE
jgi:hypothetical protein